MELYIPSASLVAAMRHLNQEELLDLENNQLRPVLACLCRFFLLSGRSSDNNTDAVWLRMHDFPEVNSIIAMFQRVDFDAIIASLRTHGNEWILSHFSPLDNKGIITEFEGSGGDNFRRLGLVLYCMVVLKRHFDMCFSTSPPTLDNADSWELVDCPTHWLSCLHVMNVAFIELGEFFNVVDYIESMLLLNSDTLSTDSANSKVSFGATLAWWLIAAHPYALNSVMERIMKWKLPQSTEAPILQRLADNRSSFISTYDQIFQQASQLLHICLGSHTISLTVLNLVCRHLSDSVDREQLVSSNVQNLIHALAVTSTLLTSSSICSSGNKSCTLVTRLQWVAKHEQSASQEFALLKKIRSDLFKILNRCVGEWNASGIPPNAHVLLTAMHIVGAFQLQIGLPKFTEQEVSTIAGLYRVDFPHTPAHIEAVCELICLSCASSELCTHDNFSICLSDWLGLWRTSRRANLDSLSGIGELIIQIGLHCYSSSSPSLGASQAQCQSSLSAVISAKLRLPTVTISSHQMTHLRKVFLSTVLPESTLASSVLLIPSTAIDSLSSSPVSGEPLSESVSMLATSCVLILLRSPIFIKHQQHLQLKDWLLAQLKHGSLTLDPLFCLLLQHQNGPWTSTITSNLSAQQANPLVGLIEAQQLNSIVEDSVRTLFSKTAQGLPQSDIEYHVNRLLGVLFYTLTSIDFAVVSGRSGALDENMGRELPNLISLVDKIPVKVILFCMEKSPANVYARIYPAFIKLLYAYFPHSCLVADCLQLFIAAKENWINWKKTVIQRPDHDQKAIDEKPYCPPDRAMVERLNLISSECFPIRPRHAAYLISLLPQFLDTVTAVTNYSEPNTTSMFKSRHLSYATAQVFAAAFASTAVAFTTKQIGLAAQELIGLSTPLISAASLLAGDGDRSHQFIVEPLSFLTHLDKRTFRNPVVLRIALWLYARLLAANRQFFAHRIMVQSATNSHQHPHGPLPPGVLVPIENADTEAAVALDLLQQCESVAFLMETCANDNVSLPVLVEVRSVICAFIHQLFLHSHQLVKLVHFQTYPLVAVPVAVALIPSIHVCLDFLPELLTTSSPTRQIFSLFLLSHIATLYPMPRAFATAKLAVDVVDTMVTTMTADKRVEYFSRPSPVLDALKRLAGCFPPLVEDIVHLILRIHGMTRSHKASNLVVSSPWPRALAKNSSYRDLENLRADLKSTLVDIVRKTKLCKIFVV